MVRRVLENFIGQTAWEQFMIISCCACFTVLVLLALPSILAIFRRVRALMAGPKQSKAEGCKNLVDDEFIERRLMERKLEQYLAFIRIVCCVFAGWDLIAVARAGRRNTNPVQDTCALLLAQTSCILLVARRGTVTRRRLDGHYSLCMLLFAGFVLAADEDDLNASLLIANTAAFFLNGFRRTVAMQALPLFAICNLVFAASTTCAVLRERGMTFLAPGQLLMTLCSAGLSSLMERGFRSYMRQSLQIQAVQELYAAACALLRSCCQVVVELDREGVIISADDNLSGFLLRSSARFDGLSFFGLLVEEDRRLFAERLQQPAMRRVGMAEQLAVTARDGAGNLLRLELLWFEYRRADGELRYMLGLKDIADETHGPAPLSTAPEMPSCGQSHSTVSSSMSSSLQDSFSSESGGEAAVLLDISDLDLRIREVTPAFCAQFGRLPLHAPFLQYVRHPDRFMAELTRFLQEDLPCAAAGPRSIRVSLQLPAGKTYMRCRVARPSLDGATGDDCIRICFAREVRLSPRQAMLGPQDQARAHKVRL